jgi:Ca2+-binding RTX toxin-like protein
VGLSRRATAFRIAFLAFSLMVALPAAAQAASVAEIVNGSFVRVNGDATDNEISVTLNGGTYTISDTTGVTPGAGCAQVGVDVTCPAAGITSTVINGAAGGDTLLGSSGRDRINGGSGPDDIDGRDGDDILNSGRGGISFDTCQDVPPFRCADDLNGGAATGVNPGFDIVTYADRTGSISTDLRPGRNFARDDDGTVDGINAIEGVIGGQASDEIIGGLFADTLNGGPGNASDTICGGLGKDTVVYSDKTEAVKVTLDGVLATDPDITATAAGTSNGARQDCRLTIKNQGITNGQPCQPDSYLQWASCRKDPTGPAPGEPELRRDCTPDDGVPGENDCVGEDIENVIGTPYDDEIYGNDPDALYGQGPRVEPQGENVLEGGGGNDLLDGGLGPDTYKGGAGFDAVSYEGRTEAVMASLDGSANDGSARDENTRNNQTDQILADVEDLIGGDGNDVLKGDGRDNVLLGGPGDDLVQGHGGDDDLGGEGGNDALEGGDGNDAMDGGAGDDLLHGGFGADTYEGGEGTDTGDFSEATTPVSVTIDGVANDGRSLEGDNVTGTVESLIGGLDDDSLSANNGNGTLQGGGGNDLLNGNLGADVLIGGPGVDTAGYGGHPGPVNVNLAVAGGDGMTDENDDVAGDVENIGGTSFDDVLAGNGTSNYINGGGGNDRIAGAEGDDFLAGGSGEDTLNGDVGNDILDGAEGNDTLNGTAGDDTLRGFTGVDVLDGGAGADSMSGGDGVDVVSYASRSGDVRVDTLGDPDDGEQGENDLVRTDVESVRTGSGDDRIDIGDGAAGAAACGGGTDEVIADPVDIVGEGCEAEGVRQAGICVPTSRTVRVSKSGQASIRMNCAFAAKGTVRLLSSSRVKTGKGKAKRINLGKKSFSGKIGTLTVKVKISKSGRSVINRKKRLSAQAILAVRRDAANAAMRTNRTKLTLRASGK